MRVVGRRLFSAAAAPAEDLVVTPRCAAQLQALGSRNPTGPKPFLRVRVDSGGCGGFQYRFQVETQRGDDDIVFEKDGQHVVTDSTSLEFLRGAVIDYTESMMRSGFSIVENPIASSKCGCGTSFSPKTFQ